jgi:hypothetical protein
VAWVKDVVLLPRAPRCWLTRASPAGAARTASRCLLKLAAQDGPLTPWDRRLRRASHQCTRQAREHGRTWRVMAHEHGNKVAMPASSYNPGPSEHRYSCMGTRFHVSIEIFGRVAIEPRRGVDESSVTGHMTGTHSASCASISLILSALC